MTILVAYASRHGATRRIAERIAEKLRAEGYETDVQSVREAGDLHGYDAFVVGSAVFYGSWLKEATQFVRRNRELLAVRPVWLFSSGPLGSTKTDEEGRDLRDAAEPKQIPELREAIAARDHRVFFGALDRSTLRGTEWVVAALPAGRKLLVEGDFRDWQDIDAWAQGIARELAPAPAGVH